jgi:tRNA pseudouridine55 synthase
MRGRSSWQRPSGSFASSTADRVTSRPSRPDARGLDGILVVAKPSGPTSHDVVALVRRLAATRRVGHGGTLDPFAEGVLPIFLGQATRLVEYHLGDRKGYRATVCFGASSATDDLEGDLTPDERPAPNREIVEAALEGFRGEIRQRPPSYSAVKVAGRRAYALARAGATVELAERMVTIHRLDLRSWNGTDPSRPIAIIDIECSAGTYIRALARDLGEAVANAAYLGALTRTMSGPFRLDDAVALDGVRAAAAEGPDSLRRLLLPIDAGLDAMPRITLTHVEVEDVARGRFIRPAAGVPGGADDGPFRLVDTEGRLVAVGARDGLRLVPTKVLISPNASGPPGSDA